jgi:hypothetical protein
VDSNQPQHSFSKELKYRLRFDKRRRIADICAVPENADWEGI